MPLTLRQHVERAERIMAICGVKTLIPQKGIPAPVRVDAGNRELEYAVSIRTAVWRHDRTGWATRWLTASDDVMGVLWAAIPEHSVCPCCISRAMAEHINRRRVYCAACGAFVSPRTLRGLVTADLRAITAALREGGIGVE